MFDYLFKTDLSEAEEQRIIKETLKYYSENLNPGFIKLKRSAKSDAHGVEWRGEGCYMYNIHGHRFIDCLGGYGVFALGHRHPHVMKRVKQTMERIGLYSQELLNPLQAVLAHEIAKRAPGDLQYVYYHCGGAESNEAAIKLARLATGRQMHVSFTNSFHGKTTGALAATNRPVLKKHFRPLLPGFQMAPYGNVELLPKYITEEIASVLIEPIQGEGGVILPPEGFLQAVRKQCDEVGALLHIDEVQSGWGRTGKYFAQDHFGVAADIVTLGKALGGGLAPQTALVANPSAFKRMDENPWWLSNTFGGSQLSCAASLATIEVYESDGILEQASTNGAYFKGLLETIVANQPQVFKEVRGLGMWMGLECNSGELGSRLADELFHRDVLVAQTINNPAVIRIQPPLIITVQQIDEVLDAVELGARALGVTASTG